MTGKLLLACALAASVIVPAATKSVAHAQGSDADKKAAIAAYKKGTSAYNLAQWDKAIKFFTEAFETYPDAAFLFNLAQTHRQADNCKEASFFYGRYLSMKPDAPNRAEVEGFIRDLDSECKRRADAAALTTGTTETGSDTGTDAGSDTGTDAGSDTGTDTETTGGTSGTDTGTDTGATGTEVADVSTGTSGAEATTGGTLTASSSEPKRASLLVAYASVGPSLMTAGDLDLPARTNITIAAGYPLHLGDVTLDVGGLVSVNPISWESEDQMSSGTVLFSSVLLNAGASYEILDKVRVRAELGLGMMIYSGLDVAGNGFSDPGVRIEDGSLSSFNTRIALGVEYAITDSLAITAQPVVFTFSPSPDGFDPGIDSVQAIQAVVGVGYKM